MLNRILRLTENGLAYEPDPRHAEMLARDIGLNMNDKDSKIPGVKGTYDESKHAPMDSLDDIIAAIRTAKISSLKVRFDEHIQFQEPVHSRFQIPRDHLLFGPIGNC